MAVSVSYLNKPNQENIDLMSKLEIWNTRFCDLLKLTCLSLA